VRFHTEPGHCHQCGSRIKLQRWHPDDDVGPFCDERCAREFGDEEDDEDEEEDEE